MKGYRGSEGKAPYLLYNIWRRAVSFTNWLFYNTPMEKKLLVVTG
jgi:hypothetical protein